MNTAQTSVPMPAACAKEGCFHCGATLPRAVIADGDKHFCCRGCLTVYQLLVENGLADFYRLEPAAGSRIGVVANKSEYVFLDNPAIRSRLISFEDENITRVTFRVPAVHCIACVWLLENLFRLGEGIGRCEVNFSRKEICITFENSKTNLSEVAALLASIGYAPELNLSDMEGKPRATISRRLWMQIAVAGFAFGNTMLFSIPAYLGLDSASRQHLAYLFGWLSLLLALPVMFFSAADYWRAAWTGMRQRRLTIEVPICVGIAALFGQSFWQVIFGSGEGYFDSFCGLIFFLLCGKAFQQKTYDRLVFERDYKSFFPLAVMRNKNGVEERVPLSQLNVGERLILHNGELVPADSRLISGTACIDYSFVTGESRPVNKTAGQNLYCGGRQVGGRIEVEMLKDISQSQLSSLWNQSAFSKEKTNVLNSLTNRYSEWFSRIVLAVAMGAAVYWWFHNPDLSFRSFTAVLIVACPCALALAAPFGLGTAQRILARYGVFVKNTQVIETLARVDTVIFDKTGTLTTPETGFASFRGRALTPEETRWIISLARESTHPYCAQILKTGGNDGAKSEVSTFVEKPGCGIEGVVDGHHIIMGSAQWFVSRGIAPPEKSSATGGGEVYLAIDGNYRGCYSLASGLREEVSELVKRLSGNYRLALVSGDNNHEEAQMRELFGNPAPLLFNQSPLDKLHFIQRWQEQRKVVLMAGDGLNDAGALRQSDVGVAVVENISSFSPASDVIMTAAALPRMQEVLQFSKYAIRVVRASLLISSVYNVAGLSIAARGLLSPVVCAILMPLSSVSVVTFACGATAWGARRAMATPISKATPKVQQFNLAKLQSADWQAVAGEEGVIRSSCFF